MPWVVKVCSQLCYTDPIKQIGKRAIYHITGESVVQRLNYSNQQRQDITETTAWRMARTVRLYGICSMCMRESCIVSFLTFRGNYEEWQVCWVSYVNTDPNLLHCKHCIAHILYIDTFNWYYYSSYILVLTAAKYVDLAKCEYLYSIHCEHCLFWEHLIYLSISPFSNHRKQPQYPRNHLVLNASQSLQTPW